MTRLEEVLADAIRTHDAEFLSPEELDLLEHARFAGQLVATLGDDAGWLEAGLLLGEALARSNPVTIERSRRSDLWRAIAFPAPVVDGPTPAAALQALLAKLGDAS